MQLRGLEQAWLELTQTCWEGLLALGMSLLLLLLLLLGVDLPELLQGMVG